MPLKDFLFMVIVLSVYIISIFVIRISFLPRHWKALKKYMKENKNE